MDGPEVRVGCCGVGCCVWGAADCGVLRLVLRVGCCGVGCCGLWGAAVWGAACGLLRTVGCCVWGATAGAACGVLRCGVLQLVLRVGCCGVDCGVLRLLKTEDQKMEEMGIS